MSAITATHLANEKQQFIPAIIVERNRNGTFAFAPHLQTSGRVLPLQVEANLYSFKMGDWIFVTRTDGQDKLRCHEKIESKDLESLHLPPIQLVKDAVQVISFFKKINYNSIDETLNVYIENLGVGSADVIGNEMSEENRLGIFTFPRDPQRTENSKMGEGWKLIRILRTSPTQEQIQRMDRMAAEIRRQATVTPSGLVGSENTRANESESRDVMPRPFTFGRQPVASPRRGGFDMNGRTSVEPMMMTPPPSLPDSNTTIHSDTQPFGSNEASRIRFVRVREVSSAEQPSSRRSRRSPRGAHRSQVARSSTTWRRQPNPWPAPENPPQV